MSDIKGLVMVDRGRFLKEFDQATTTATVTDTMSDALVFSYEAADALVRRLRKRGFSQAVVTSIDGSILNYERMRALRVAITVAEKNPPLPQSWEDLHKIPGTECVQRAKKQPGFKEAVDRIMETPQPAPKPRRV